MIVTIGRIPALRICVIALSSATQLYCGSFGLFALNPDGARVAVRAGAISHQRAWIRTTSTPIACQASTAAGARCGLESNSPSSSMPTSKVAACAGAAAAHSAAVVARSSPNRRLTSPPPPRPANSFRSNVAATRHPRAGA